MFTADRQTVLAALYLMGATCCAYSVGDTWANRCDCKYGIGERGGWPYAGEAGNGCPELRSLHSLIEAMTDEEWALLIRRSGGMPTALFAASRGDVEARLHRADAAARMAAANIAEVRGLLTLEQDGRRRRDSR